MLIFIWDNYTMSMDRCECCERIVDTDIHDLYREGFRFIYSLYGSCFTRSIGDIAKLCDTCWEYCLEMSGIEE